MPPLPLRPAPDPTPALASLSRTLADVRSYQLPRLRGCSTAALARDLAAEARTDLEGVRVGLEESRETCEALPERTRTAVLAMWEGVEEEYLAVRDEFRAALVQSKRATAASSKRHELLDPNPEDVPRAEPTVGVGGDDALQTKTNEVTDAMRRTTQLLQAELERSVLSTQMLDESTRTLRTTHGLYDNYTALLTTSSQLVRALERADWWDRVLIMGALGFFLLCVAYVVKRRVLDRVGGFAVWWVGGSYRLLKMIGGGGGSGAKSVADVAGLATGPVGQAIDGVTVAGTGAAAAAAAASAASAAAAAAAAAVVGASGEGRGLAAGSGLADEARVDLDSDLLGEAVHVAVPVAEDLGRVDDGRVFVGHVPLPEGGAGEHAVEHKDGDAHVGVEETRGADREGEKSVVVGDEGAGGRTADGVPLVVDDAAAGAASSVERDEL